MHDHEVDWHGPGGGICGWNWPHSYRYEHWADGTATGTCVECGSEQPVDDDGHPLPLDPYPVVMGDGKRAADMALIREFPGKCRFSPRDGYVQDRGEYRTVMRLWPTAAPVIEGAEY